MMKVINLFLQADRVNLRERQLMRNTVVRDTPLEGYFQSRTIFYKEQMTLLCLPSYFTIYYQILYVAYTFLWKMYGYTLISPVPKLFLIKKKNNHNKIQSYLCYFCFYSAAKAEVYENYEL